MSRSTSVSDESGPGQETQPCAIAVYRGGPYLVRGSFELVGEDGVRLPLRRRTIALCRCGRSARVPFCDGAHKGLRAMAREAAEERPVPRPAAA